MIEDASGVGDFTRWRRRSLFLREEHRPPRSRCGLWSRLPSRRRTPERYRRDRLQERCVLSGALLRFSPDGSTLLVWLGADPTPIRVLSGRSRRPAASRGGAAIAVGPGRDCHRAFQLAAGQPPHRRHAFRRAHPGNASVAGGYRRQTSVRRRSQRPRRRQRRCAERVSPEGHTIAFNSEATDFDLVEVPLDGSPLRPYPEQHSQRVRSGGLASEHSVRLRDRSRPAICKSGCRTKRAICSSRS